MTTLSPSRDAREEQTRRLALFEAFITFFATLDPRWTLQDRAEAWRAVDIARLRHEDMMPETR